MYICIYIYIYVCIYVYVDYCVAPSHVVLLCYGTKFINRPFAKTGRRDVCGCKLKHTATKCNTLQTETHCSIMQHIAN